MKRPRRKIALSAVILLVVALGVPAGLTVREVRQHRRDHDFLAAIKANDVSRILQLLDAGADLQARDSEAPPLNFWQALLAHLKRQKPAAPGSDASEEPTALEQIYSEEPKEDDPKSLPQGASQQRADRANPGSETPACPTESPA